MNYLSHFVFNHEVLGVPRAPHFAMGVVLPDLWLRFSRTRRIRWKPVRAAAPPEPEARALRAGLLNHVDVDRCFHTLPVFIGWQRQIKDHIEADGVHPALLDFVVHMSIELALDHRLLHGDDGRLEAFYDCVSEADPGFVATTVGELGRVDTAGLDSVLQRFVERRFLHHYRSPAGLVDVVQIVLSLAAIEAPEEKLIGDIVAAACAEVEPEAVWEQLAPAYRRVGSVFSDVVKTNR